MIGSYPPTFPGTFASHPNEHVPWMLSSSFWRRHKRSARKAFVTRPGVGGPVVEAETEPGIGLL